ncbi:MAG: double zinc ribbon domain-containing protein [Blastocatellia bacterium]
MGFKADEADLRADSNQGGEIDLYDELVAFSSLSPEDRGRGQSPSFANDPVPAPQSAAGFVYANPADSGGAGAGAAPAPGDLSPEPISFPSFELTDRAGPRPVENPPASPIEDFPFELPYEPVNDIGGRPSFGRLQADQSGHGGTGDLDLAYLLRVTGPLIALNVSANPASPLLVCKDCRSQSSSGDMFCVTCGGLLEGAEIGEDGIDEAEVPVPAVGVAAAIRACGNCNYIIEEDEIFCPSCGTVL